MDVQPAPNVGPTGGNTAPAPTVTTGTTHESTPVATQQVSTSTQTSDSHQEGGTLAPAVAKLFSAANAAPAQLSVSYRVEGTDVVTVFTDPSTHKEVAQFPPELLLGLAQFFDQQSGITFDKSA